jgi:NADH:ubiquinone oxidoreductase subunit E
MTEQKRVNLLVCAGTGCVAAGSLEIKKAIDEEIGIRGLENEAGTVLTGCNGQFSIRISSPRIFLILLKNIS